MAKLIGPLMSMDASGTVAGTLTFAKWKGRNYVRQRVIPSNPQTAAQTGVRATFGGTIALYKANKVALDSAFDTLAKQRNFSPINAFTGFTQKQFSKGFSAANSPNPTNEAPAANDTALAANIEGKYVTLTWTDSASEDAWASSLYMKEGGAPSAVWNLQIALIPAGVQTFTLGPLAAGDYQFASAAVSENGGQIALGTPVTATVE